MYPLRVRLIIGIKIPVVWNQHVRAGEPNARELEPDRRVAAAITEPAPRHIQLTEQLRPFAAAYYVEIFSSPFEVHNMLFG